MTSETADIELHCLGASREVGRSAFLLKTDKNLLLDYGLKIFDKSGQPQFPEPFSEKIDAMILSHAHLDHSGFIPHLYSGSGSGNNPSNPSHNLKWFSTPPTRDLCEILWPDSMKIMGDTLPYKTREYHLALKHWVPVAYERRISFGETQMTLSDAGHIAGAALVELEYHDKVVLYTGDFKNSPTRLHGGVAYDYDVNTLIMDSTYAKREHPDRKKLEQKLMDEIHETTDNGGTALLPAFSLGRSQELISIIRAHDRHIPIYLDGMGKDISLIYARYPGYISDVKKFRKDLSTVVSVRKNHQRMEATREPAVIVSSAGMMEGGPVLGYVVRLNPNSKIILTGYSVEGSNAWRLLNENALIINGNRLEAEFPVEYLDFSAHAGRSDLLNMIKSTNPEKIVLVHGDSTEEFERELKEDFGLDAVAPKLGDVIKL
ncbi:TPA: MBL fold metallo-hydrolase [Candidatus Micrarchaeota archaeon]|nr:MBL fold metallo-hydrolase [Candidatus Micrarchaeota archaeon]